MFNLSGAINVLLFLIVRPHLLLFPRPEKLAEPVMELASSPQGTSTAIFSDRANLQHSPEPTSAALVVGEGSRNNPALSASILDECRMTSNHFKWTSLFDVACFSYSVFLGSITIPSTVYGRMSVSY
jgi:hypothetical protein